jgi:hypothetical protein
VWREVREWFDRMTFTGIKGAIYRAKKKDFDDGFSGTLFRPTVSPAKNSLVYFISIAYIDHPVWRSHREEAKRGPPSGHRLTRNERAMLSLLLP